MELSQSILSVEPSYFKSICEESNSLSLEPYGSSFTTANESVGSDQANILSTYATTSGVEAWSQYKYGYLLF